MLHSRDAGRKLVHKVLRVPDKCNRQVRARARARARVRVRVGVGVRVRARVKVGIGVLAPSEYKTSF